MRNRIRELRNAAKLSQAGLADLVGTSQAQIARLETSDRRLTAEWMQRIARALHVSPADLFVTAQPADHTAAEVELLANFRAMAAHSRDTLLDLSRQITGGRPRTSTPTGKRASLQENPAGRIAAPRKPHTLHDEAPPLLAPRRA